MFSDYDCLKGNELIIDSSLMSSWMGQKLAKMRALDLRLKPLNDNNVSASCSVITPSTVTTDKKRAFESTSSQEDCKRRRVEEEK
jgi:hypothetical protein